MEDEGQACPGNANIPVSDQRLEIDLALRHKGDGEWVIARLMATLEEENEQEGKTYAVSERTLVVELFRDE
jgi:hypothetical protein